MLEVGFSQGLEVSIKSQSEIESAISQGVSRFEQKYMDRDPKDIRAHLIGDLIVVRLIGFLSEAEKQMAKSLPDEKGRDLLKHARAQLIETSRPALVAMIEVITGTKVLSLHHDISTVTGEKVLLFALAESPTKLSLSKASKPQVS
jgi:uncharacterized protein YbcI